MSGTTLCPHCDTRFKIAQDQLEAHQGRVRCGNCLQAFDAIESFVPDEPDPQLELPITEVAETAEVDMIGRVDESSLDSEEQPLPPVMDMAEAEAAAIGDNHELPKQETIAAKCDEGAGDDTLDFSQPLAAQYPEPSAAIAPAKTTAEENAPEESASDEISPAEKVYLREPLVIRHKNAVDEKVSPILPKRPSGLAWVVGILLLLALLAQAAFFFRVELAARLPGIKPILVSYCGLFGSHVPLPQNSDKMSIESSELEADPYQESHITLHALLRNHDGYTQAFPDFELTLNDDQDKPVARRIFKPTDYLPPMESENAGLQPNHELLVNLSLDTADLKPSGYRLVLFYPVKNRP
jgi:predicted Zn finger-like uncharacterized protein